MPEVLLSAAGIRLSYGTGRLLGGRKQVLRGVDLEVAAGETVGIIGSSGAGKSALGRIMAGMEAPTEGAVSYRGRSLSIMSGQERAAFRRRVQILFQDPEGALNPLKTVRASMGEVCGLIGLRGGEADAEIARRLASVGLTADVLARRPTGLSGGQNQRVALARVLMLEPELIVLDEPTSGLDVSVQAGILRLLRGIQDAARIAYVFISHDAAVVRFICHRVLELREGHILPV